MAEDSLYLRVTRAIFEAERAEAKDPRSEETQVAYAKVSELEQEIANLKSLKPVERNIGRRGAVTAAIMAGDTERAKSLLNSYEGEEDFPPDLNQELHTFVANPELVYAMRIPVS